MNRWIPILADYQLMDSYIRCISREREKKEKQVKEKEKELEEGKTIF